MKSLNIQSRRIFVWAPVLLGALLTACGGQSSILGGVMVTDSGPRVTAVSPTSNASAVPVNAKQITATFDRAMDAATIGGTSFTLACPSTTPVTGVVSYVAASYTAVLTLPALPNLPVNTVCVATINTAAKSVSGQAVATPFVWTWTTAATPDLTAPTVASTNHANGAVNVPTNTKIGVTFNEAMNAASVNGTSFLVQETIGAIPVAGTVVYSGNNAVFTPTAPLSPATQYTVTVKGLAGGVSDISGNVMAADYVWSWTTTGAADVSAPTVSSSSPTDMAAGVCVNKTISITFNKAMDPTTLSNSTFMLSVSGGSAVNGLVTYDALTRIASFDPTSNLVGAPATNYIATIKGGAMGVRDMAGNAMSADKVIYFSTGAANCAAAPVLGAAAPFGGFGGNATLTNDGLNTVVNGDIGVNAASTTITGLRDSGGNVYTVTPDNDGTVNGTIYTLTAPPGSVAGAAVTQARSDALLAFNSISPASLPGGVDVSSLAQCPSCGGAGQGPGQLAGRTLPPGVYLSTTGTYGIGITVPTAGNLTLDAGGDANAVWVFQTSAGSGTLTVGVTGPATPAVPIQVLLINGATAKNVFWYVPGGASIGTGATMVGTLLSDAAITISTTGGSPPTAVQTTLNGRAIALTAGVTMTNTLVNVPAP